MFSSQSDFLCLADCLLSLMRHVNISVNKNQTAPIEISFGLFFFFFPVIVCLAHGELVRHMRHGFKCGIQQMCCEGMSRTNSQLAVRDLDSEYVEHV